MTTNYAVAPGEYLEEWIEDQGTTQQQVADRLGSSRKQVNEIVNGRAPITAETAIRLERVVGIPADAWLGYEVKYRADLRRIADEENLAQHADDIEPAAITFLRKLGFISATKRHPGKLVSEFLAFHRCGTWGVYEDLHETSLAGEYALSALTESRSDVDRTLLTTWLRAAELTEAFEHARTFAYSEGRLRDALPVLRARAATPDASILADLTEMLAGAGVALVFVEPPKRFPLMGMTRWIDERVPVIQQTGRRGTDGFIIWTLFHEIGHVLNDPRGEMHFDFTEKQRATAAEKAANKFALDMLFGPDGIEPLRGLRSDSQIRAAAAQIGISPGVAVHQMHRCTWLKYWQGNDLLVNLNSDSS